MINTNGGLFYGTLIDSGTLSSILKDLNGNTITGGSGITCYRSGGSTGNSIASRNNFYNDSGIRTFARVGYGHTLPTINDYCLENEVSEEININDILICAYGANDFMRYSTSSVEGTGHTRNPDGTMCYEFTFYNNTDNAITFYEIGLFVNANNSQPVSPFMVARNVNPNGWIVPARENITITIELDFACNQMITRQGGRYFTSIFGSGQYGFYDYRGIEITWTIDGRPTGASGTTQAVTPNAYTGSSTYGTFARLGVGQSANSEPQYTMEQEELDGVNVNTTITCSSAVLYPNRTTNGKWDYTYTFNNSGSSSITVYEMGLFVRHPNAVFMIGRMVNENGWTFAAGESKTIVATIQLCGATNEMETAPINNG